MFAYVIRGFLVSFFLAFLFFPMFQAQAIQTTCTSDAQCSAIEATNGWKGSKCSGTPTTPGVCLEAPRGESKLPDTAPAINGVGLIALVDTVTNWVFAIFVVLSIIFVLLAAFQFVTGGGDAKKVEEARQKLIWASVGIIIALLAKGLVPVIRNIVGG